MLDQLADDLHGYPEFGMDEKDCYELETRIRKLEDKSEHSDSILNWQSTIRKMAFLLREANEEHVP